jgi:hypothetical protein
MCGGFGGLDQYATPPTPTGDERPMLGGGLLMPPEGGRYEFAVPDESPGDYNNPDKIDAPGVPTMRGSGMGNQGIAPYLQGIISLAKNKEFNDIDIKTGPYFEEVQQITDRTFPDLFGGNSMGGGRLGALGALQQETIGNMLANNQNSLQQAIPQNYSNIAQARGSRAKIKSGPYKMS